MRCATTESVLIRGSVRARVYMRVVLIDSCVAHRDVFILSLVFRAVQQHAFNPVRYDRGSGSRVWVCCTLRCSCVVPSGSREPMAVTTINITPADVCVLMQQVYSLAGGAAGRDLVTVYWWQGNTSVWADIRRLSRLPLPGTLSKYFLWLWRFSHCTLPSNLWLQATLKY